MSVIFTLAVYWCVFWCRAGFTFSLVEDDVRKFDDENIRDVYLNQ